MSAATQHTPEPNPRSRASRLGWLGAAMLVALGGVSWVLAGGNLLFRTPSGQIAESKWDTRQLPVKFILSSDGFPGSGITNAQLLTEFNAAFANWQNIGTSAVAFQSVTLGAQNSTGGQSTLFSGMDGKNVITFTDPRFTFSGDVLAVCSSMQVAEELIIDDGNADIDSDGVRDLPNGTYPPGTLLDADIIFDSKRNFNIGGGTDAFDIRQVAMHEIGHCIGLSHSSIPTTTMWPRYNLDVASGRILKADDISQASRAYPDTTYNTTYGTIRGRVVSGDSGLPIRGAHVFAENITTRQKVIGAYTTDTGDYVLAVPGGNNYYIGIEPLDGEPDELRPERINRIIADTTDVRFPTEYYDLAESNHDDPAATTTVNVFGGGSVVNNINMTTNLDPGIQTSLNVERGINYISYPIALGSGVHAYQVLSELASQGGVTSIERYDSALGQFQRTQMLNGAPRGPDFLLKRGEGYIVHSTEQVLLSFSGAADCPAFDLAAGLNLIGAPCAPAGYSAYDLLNDLGDPATVISVQHFRRDNGTFEVAQLSGNQPTGADFAVEEGGAYIVELRTARLGFRINKGNQAIAPSLISVSPGEALPGAIVTLSGVGFSSVAASNAVTFNSTGADVIQATTQQLVVRVPYNAVSGTVRVTVSGAASNTLPFFVVDKTVEAVEGETPDILNGQQINGKIDNPNDVDYYRFLAVAGNRVTLTARATTGFVPVLEMTLMNPAGGVIAGADSSTTGQAAIGDLLLTSPGYYVVAIRTTPDGGTGPYRLKIDLTGTPGDPQVQIIGGNYQTGVAGTELATPVEIVAVGSGGLAAAQVPITINVTPTVDPNGLAVATSDPRFTEVSSSTMNTSRSGNLGLRVILPASGVGEFDIVVSAPGMKPARLYVAAIDRPVARVEITPSIQETCGDSGCIVGQRISVPYKLRYFDAADLPIAGVIGVWGVVAGDGSLEAGQGAIACRAGTPPESRCTKSAADGTVSMYHKLGTKMYFAQKERSPTDSGYDPNTPLIPIPQQVAATMPGQAAPVVFSARPRAAEPTQFYTLRPLTNQRLTLGSAVLGIVRVMVLDEFNNPVQGEPVSFGTLPPGIVQVPGYNDGQVVTFTVTNRKGIWSAGLGASPGVARPTIDEFGNKGTAGLGPQYSIPIRIPRVGVSDALKLDVDMGPEVLEAGSAASSDALIGKLAPPVLWAAIRYQRFDTDDGPDNGDWRNNTDFLDVRGITLPNVALNLTYRRVDRRYLSDSGLTPTKIGGQLAVTRTTVTDGTLLVNDVRLGSVAGPGALIATIQPFLIDFRFSTEGHSTSDGPPMGQQRLVEFPDSRAIPMNADPVVLLIDLNDDYTGPTENRPSPDPFPTLPLASGVDPGQVSIKLNNVDVFAPYQGGSTAIINTFPYYGRVVLDGVEYAPGFVCATGGACLPLLRPQHLRFIYHPSVEQLQMSAPNSVDTELVDGALNPTATYHCSFMFGVATCQ